MRGFVVFGIAFSILSRNDPFCVIKWHIKPQFNQSFLTYHLKIITIEQKMYDESSQQTAP